MRNETLRDIYHMIFPPLLTTTVSFNSMNWFWTLFCKFSDGKVRPWVLGQATSPSLANILPRFLLSDTLQIAKSQPSFALNHKQILPRFHTQQNSLYIEGSLSKLQFCWFWSYFCQYGHHQLSRAGRNPEPWSPHQIHWQPAPRQPDLYSVREILSSRLGCRNWWGNKH